MGACREKVSVWRSQAQEGVGVSHSQHTGVPQLSLGTRGPGGEKGGPLRSHLHEI